MGKTNYSRCIEESCLMDDLFFELFFKKDPKYIEVVIREIFNKTPRNSVGFSLRMDREKTLEPFFGICFQETDKLSYLEYILGNPCV